jgi:hypothetical protein
MSRPIRGNLPWKAVSVKSPPQLLAEVERYADLSLMSLLALLREGAEPRLHG